MVVGCGGSLWFCWPVCSYCHLSVARSCRWSWFELTQLLPRSPGLVGEGGWGQTGLGVYSFFLFSGFSCIDYSPLRLESFSWPFTICLVRILLPGRSEEDGVGMFLHLWNPLWVLECCHPLHHFSAPDPGLSLDVYPDYCLCLFSLPSRSSPPVLHWNFISWGCGKSLIGSDSCLCPSLACVPCLSDKPPSDISMHGALRCVSVLGRELIIWVIAVHLVTSRKKTWRSFYTVMWLTSLIQIMNS